MAISIKPLKYSISALEPIISQKTLEFHYGKHLQNYVNTTNSMIENTPMANKQLVDIVKNSSGALFNNAAQAWNHEFYFDCLSPQTKKIPTLLEEKLIADFGSVENFKTEFINKAVSNFGSGWTWLVKEANTGKLIIVNTSNAETPITGANIPLLVIDVWEHAYYLDYQNLRKSYVEKFMEHADWDFVCENLAKN